MLVVSRTHFLSRWLLRDLDWVGLGHTADSHSFALMTHCSSSVCHSLTRSEWW